MDLVHALRMLRRSPATGLIIILTLALCIGANTAIFSVVDAVFLRPLPYPEPDRLTRVVTHYRAQGAEYDNTGQTGRVWEDVRDHASFLDSAVYSGGSSNVNFSAAGSVQQVKQQRVGAGFFRAMGIPPMLGREFTREEDRPGGPAVAVLSHALWHRVYHLESNVIGQTLLLRGEPYTIVGVMPESFRSNVPADLWTPLRPTVNGEGGGSNYSIIGRIKPGVSWQQADSQLASISATMFKSWHPESHARLHIITLQEGQAEDIRKPVLILWSAVGLVLLIGCANVASILLAKSASRTREIATRMALGGGRAVIVRQLLVETTLLAILGGAAGLLFGDLALEGLKKLAAENYQMVESAHLDARVLLATLMMSLIVSLLAGIFPALQAARFDIRAALSEAGGRAVAGGSKRWSRRLLVAGEIALAVLLLIGAGLLVRTVTHFYQLMPGFEPAHLLAASFSLQDARYDDVGRVNKLFNDGLSRIRALPGVESAGAALTLPYQRGLNVGVALPGGPPVTSENQLTNYSYVTPGYLETIRVPLLQGRTIRDSDTAKSQHGVVVSTVFVRRFLAGHEPIGSHLDFGNNEIAEVVGVVGDVQQSAGFGNFGPLGAVPMVYAPVSQQDGRMLKLLHQWFDPNWVVRYNGAPSGVIPGIQSIASTIDPLIPISEFKTFDDLLAVSVSEQRFQATLLGSIAGLALVLAIVGIYGLMSQSVVERTRELGIRMALGASVSQAIREATTPGIVLAVSGVAIGCVLAGLSTKVLTHLVWGVTPTDPATYTLVAVGLLLVAAAASLIPALRITNLSPTEALRDE